jgi:hypothetical protein
LHHRLSDKGFDVATDNESRVFLSMKRVLLELDALREVINIYPSRRRLGIERKQTVLTKISEVQQHLMSILMFKKEENSVLA